MNKTIGIIIAIIVIIGGVYLYTRTSNNTNLSETNTASTTPESSQTNQAAVAQGRAVFSVTDAATNMSTISEITMKINSVDVHSATTGWTTVSTNPQVFNLLTLNAKNQSQLLADANISEGTYDQVRLMVDSITVTTKAGATTQAKLPSGELKINTNLIIKAGGATSINFDFLASKSLHITGNGKYIFAPVVKTESRSDSKINVDANNVVKVSAGKVDDTNTVGMDIDGSIKKDFQIKSDQKLEIDTNNAIKLKL
ncbi:MAG: DUF4382 domain-containing protein [Patescibacteria group bacterium]|nr:DUF4382 domain-containing protein [Patescibacteria group bacterium]